MNLNYPYRWRLSHLCFVRRYPLILWLITKRLTVIPLLKLLLKIAQKIFLLKKRGMLCFKVTFPFPNIKHHFSSESIPTTEKAVVPTRHNSKQSPKIRWATLYIQMALCHGTLDQWLRRRNEFFDADVAIMPCGSQPFSTKAIRQILMQILRGESLLWKICVFFSYLNVNFFKNCRRWNNEILYDFWGFLV